MIYEMRVYDVMPGRLHDLIKRFETKAMPLWKKHGIRQAGFFTTMVGTSSSSVTYFFAWETLDEREQKYGAFQADPEWHAARTESEKNGGPLVARVANQLLTPTSFSTVK
jgi:hypothetical protein